MSLKGVDERTELTERKASSSPSRSAMVDDSALFFIKHLHIFIAMFNFQFLEKTTVDHSG